VTVAERGDLEQAWVLHGRAWRETSEIVELLTPAHGRVSVVARGLRRPGAAGRALLQPFRPLLVSWSGRGSSLMTLRAAEARGQALALQGTALMSAFYLNELVLRFLHKGDPHSEVFAGYEQAVLGLGAGGAPEAILRRFELTLLAEAGYGLSLERDAESGSPLDPAGRYRYVVERGPVPAAVGEDPATLYSGAELAAIGQGALDGAEHLRAARRLLRTVLDHHLGARPLRTRRVFAAMKREG
jgi:DNA repair protein RecO (recombination protein O)